MNNTILYHLTPESKNEKTGPIPVSTTGRQSCWEGCAFFEKGCYAKGGPLGMHWAKVTEGERGTSFSDFAENIKALPQGQLWRHNQAGDLPGNGGQIDVVALAQLVVANEGKRGFTYTHKPVAEDTNLATTNRAAVRQSNERGFTINLSGNTLKHADILSGLNAGPVVVVVPESFPDRGQTPAGRKVVVCPAQRVVGMTCDKCRLCSLSTRPFIIGFKPHGMSRKTVNQIAST